MFLWWQAQTKPHFLKGACAPTFSFDQTFIGLKVCSKCNFMFVIVLIIDTQAERTLRHWVRVANMLLEAMRASWENNWRWSDQSATQNDLRTPAGRNPITVATASDRWVQRKAPPQDKSQAIEVMLKQKSPVRSVHSSFLLATCGNHLAHAPSFYQPSLPCIVLFIYFLSRWALSQHSLASMNICLWKFHSWVLQSFVFFKCSDENA